MTLAVIEVIERAKEGRTEPYICRCDDGDVYFVKGHSATRHGLINEWLCGHLARALGIPVAPFDVAFVPEEFAAADDTGWLRDLGVGPVFASRRAVAQDLSAAQVALVPQQVRRACWCSTGGFETTTGTSPSMAET